jgi:hypothetical protein
MEIFTGAISIQNILEYNNNWETFVMLYGGQIRDVVFENIDKLLSCRKSLGHHLYMCLTCGKLERIMHSCKSRICSSCGKMFQDAWLSKTLSSILPVEYQHLVFTVPEQLRRLFLTHRKLMLDILFKASAQAIQNVMQREYNCKPGILAVTHSFGNDLKSNFHIHIIVTCGGLSTISNKWIRRTFIPEQPLKAEFKFLMLKYLREAHKTNKFHFNTKKKKFFLYKIFNRFLNRLYNIQWYVNIGRSLKDASFAIAYVTRYTKKPVIAQSRIKRFENNEVTFEYKDHATNSYKLSTMHALDFIKAFVKHIPDRYFHQLRYYGLFANKIKSEMIEKALVLLGKTLPHYTPAKTFQQRFVAAFGFDRLLCCNMQMSITEIFYPKKYGGPPCGHLEAAKAA